MMCAYRFLIATAGVCLFYAQIAVAQSVPIDDVVRPPIIPVISGPADVAAGRTVVLDASNTVVRGEDVEYRWYREGITQPISRTVEAVYTPEQIGTTLIRLVVTATVDGEPVEASAEHRIIVYERKIVLVADASIPREKLVIHQQEAERQGVFLRVLQPKETALPLEGGGMLFTVISEGSSALVGAESIVLWTDGIAGLQALQRVMESDPDKQAALRHQTIIMIAESGLHTLARTARGPFTLLMPDRIIVTRTEALTPLIGAADIDGFLDKLDQWDLAYLVVDESTLAVRPWNLLSVLTTYMITHGVSSRTVVLLLMLPLIATILAFLKQVVGVTTFGLYMPSVIALSFLALGWTIGVSFLLFILVTGYATRTLMRRWRLLYIPKVAIILTVVSLTLLLLLGLGAYFGLTLSGDTIFILLIMSTLSESFLNVKAEQGWYGAIVGIAETVLAALLCVFIVQWSVLQSFVLAYPELILLTLLVNAFLGRWTGLRLVEYFRFREVFRQMQEE